MEKLMKTINEARQIVLESRNITPIVEKNNIVLIQNDEGDYLVWDLNKEIDNSSDDPCKGVFFHQHQAERLFNELTA